MIPLTPFPARGRDAATPTGGAPARPGLTTRLARTLAMPPRRAPAGHTAFLVRLRAWLAALFALALAASVAAADPPDWKVNQDTSLAPGTYVFDELQVSGQATLTLLGDPTAGPHGAGVTIIARRLRVAPNARISADGQGFVSGEGPGTSPEAVWGAAGAGHGGRGSNGEGHLSPGGTPYGDPLSPTALGSGGGRTPEFPGGAGGGAIRLVVSEDLRLDGVISADGLDAPYDFTGGGSGGSLWIETASLTGSGLLSARGGSSHSGGGGSGAGGRLRLDVTTETFLDGGRLELGGGDRNSAEALGTAVLPARDDLVVTGRYALLAGLHTFTTLSVPAGQMLGARGDPAAGPNGLGVELLVDELRVEDGGRLTADGCGFPAGRGPGAGETSVWSPGGGSHGGRGGDGFGSPAGPVYGLEGVPLGLGSGSGTSHVTGPHVEGSGGGALRVQARLLHVDGRISADGLLGGAGGSLLLCAETLTGAGEIHARGGIDQRADSAGGGGGRVSIHAPLDTFTGTVDAWGGFGHKAPGQPGSVNRTPVAVFRPSLAAAGTGGFRPHLGARGGPPRPGNTDFGVELAGALGGAWTSFVLGLDPLEHPLGGGNTLWLLPRFFWGAGPAAGTGPGTGERSLALPLPADPALVGLTARIQGYVPDPANPAQLALTELLLVTLLD